MTTLRRPEVICIAASTGGPQAVTELLEAFSIEAPIPILIVQHMPASFTARFASRLDRITIMTVAEAVSGMALRAGLVLVAPGSGHLRIDGGHARVSHAPPVGGLRPRADLTLRDVAREYGAGVTAVVLSGMGTDGLEGCRSVVQAGGQVLTQDAATAAVDGMPARVRQSGLSDLDAPPAALGRALEHTFTRVDRRVSASGGRRSHRPGGRRATDRPEGDHTRDGLGDRQAAEVGAWPAGDRLLADRAASAARSQREPLSVPPDVPLSIETQHLVNDVMYRHEHIDLSAFKEDQFGRRLATFARHEHLDTDQALVDALDAQPSVRRALLDRVTVNVTSFFRDPLRWADLDRLVLPGLPAEPRVWAPGCADGSEAFSLTMLMLEAGLHPSVWATDLHPARIDDARRGSFTAAALTALDGGPGPVDRRTRWFTPDGDRWRVGAEVRDAVRFEQHDAIHDPLPSTGPGPAGPSSPTGAVDLIVCRNVVIYLNADGRDRLLHRAHDLLADHGVLFLGNAERMLRPDQYGFAPIAPGIYRRTDAPGLRR